MSRLLTGDFGKSQSLSHPVRELLAERVSLLCGMVAFGLTIAGLGHVPGYATWPLRAEGLEKLCTVSSGLLLCFPAGVWLSSRFNGCARLSGSCLSGFSQDSSLPGYLVSSTSRMPHMITAYSKGV